MPNGLFGRLIEINDDDDGDIDIVASLIFHDKKDSFQYKPL